MPAYLDFDTTKKFRDSILSRTLNKPNGPQTFDSANYIHSIQNDYPNIDSGDVVKSTDFNRENALNKIHGRNVHTPDEFGVYENQNEYPVKDSGDVVKSTDFNREDSLSKTQGKNINTPNEFGIYENQNDYPVKDSGDVVKSTDFNREDSLNKTHGRNINTPDEFGTYENQNEYPVKDSGDVVKSTDFNREDSLSKTQGKNINTPNEFGVYENQNDYPVKDSGDVVKSSNFDREETLSRIQGKNINTPNEFGVYENQNDYSVKDSGDVNDNTSFNSSENLNKLKQTNKYTPNEDYFIVENLQHKHRELKKELKSYETLSINYGSDFKRLISIINSNDYENESELMKFARNHILNDKNGVIQARTRQNIYSATLGRANIIDAFSNATTAIDILTGHQELIQNNYKITVAKTLAGKVVDFVQTVAGVEFPWTEIPGNYYRENDKKLASPNPSDIMVDYMGKGQQRKLYDNLAYNKYAPDYSRSARRGESNAVRNFVDNIVGSVKDFLGLEGATSGLSYIGDNRNNTVTNFFVNGKSTYYLATFFDPNLAKFTGTNKSIGDGGSIGGELTWYSDKEIPNKLGDRGGRDAKSNFNKVKETLSSNETFGENTILNETQKLVDHIDTTTGKRSEMSKIIDQTTRLFKEGEQKLSRGSAVIYSGSTKGGTTNRDNIETGEEFCRVWTKDNAYTTMGDLIRKNGNMRKFRNSVVDSTFNLNIAPNSGDGYRTFDGSTNIIKDSTYPEFYAKKYMFSIENLAWKSSNIPGFTYDDLPNCERGNNGGRVMWFPPYNLKVNEQNSVRWEENEFIGRPEPIYTYINTARNANISFDVIVDHPSILNYLTNEYWDGLTDNEVNELISSFFSGCLEDDIDFYSLLLQYPGLTKTELEVVLDYIRGNKDKTTTFKYKRYLTPPESSVDDIEKDSANNSETPNSEHIKTEVYLYYENDTPDPLTTRIETNKKYSDLYEKYTDGKDDYLDKLKSGIDDMYSNDSTNDLLLLSGESSFADVNIDDLKNTLVDEINDAFQDLTKKYEKFEDTLTSLKNDLKEDLVKDITLSVNSSTSAVADNTYNLNLSFRRSYSIITDLIKKIALPNAENIDKIFNWPDVDLSNKNQLTVNDIRIPLNKLGYENGGKLIIKNIVNEGELGSATQVSGDKNINCGNKNFETKDLKITAPIAFYCRKSFVVIEYDKVQLVPEKETTKTPDEPENDVSIIPIPSERQGRPSVDQVKKIIMKILSECYYFKTLKEDSPSVFTSLKDQLKYFHPSFHSMTPEGLNSRLTFIQQCLRPGDTIPVKGINNINDLNARNTTFGPPPICVLRIGDFFHSKMVIRDVNISYEDSLWDFNPEGIGMQPMIAKVTMTVGLFGGHGLERPVERLQNALSFNFYGNTEMYDHRSTATEERRSFYQKSDLEELLEKEIEKANKTVTDVNAHSNIIDGEYIGEVTDNSLSYDNLINAIYNDSEIYINKYIDTFNYLNETYGNNLTSMFISNKYRTINTFKLNNTPINMLGEYPKKLSLSTIIGKFGTQLKNKLKNTNLTEFIGLNTIDKSKSEIILQKYANKTIDNFVDNESKNNNVLTLEETRNDVIKTMDKLNFILETSYDAKIMNSVPVGLSFTDFNSTVIYANTEPPVSFVDEISNLITQNVDDSHDYTDTTTLLSDELFKEFLGILWLNKKQDIVTLLSDGLKTNNIKTNNIKKKIDKFVGDNIIGITKIKKPTFPMRDDNNPIIFTIDNENHILSPEESEKYTKTMSMVDNSNGYLNYYRKNG